MTHEQTSVCWQWPWAIPTDTLSAICQIVPLFWMCKMWKLGQGIKKCWSPIHFEHCNTNNELSINLSLYFCCFYLLVVVSMKLMNISVKPVKLMQLTFCKILFKESCWPLLDLTYAAVYFTLLSFLQLNGHVDFAEQSCRFRLVFLWGKM